MAQEKKERIFISYKRVDKERVFAIKDGIEQATGEKCWIDLDGIESDAQFVAKIMTAIDQCDVFLFMRSNAHNKIVDLTRDWTYREVNYALIKEKIIVFINLDNSQSPDWVSFMFPHQQEIDATDPDKLARLNKDLCEWLQVDVAHVETSGGEKNNEKVNRYVLEWNAENCIECNYCASVCPTSSIRPFVMDGEEMKGVQGATRVMKLPITMKGMHYRLQIGVLDCIGCGKCVARCPGHPKAGKALTMMPLEGQMIEAQNWSYCTKNVKSKRHLVDVSASIKYSQFW
jgi:ferredoxin